jgi:hypothetical protein
MPATFGELTELAHAHLDAAARHDLGVTSVEQQAAIAAALGTCTRAVSRLVDVPPQRRRVTDPAARQAAEQLRDNLTSARQLLHTALPRALNEGLAEHAARAHPAAAHLISAAVTIGASRDLLETHTLWTATGRQDRSELAKTIDTPAARRRLTATAAAHAEQLASLTATLAVGMGGTTVDRKARLVLNAAESLAAAASTATTPAPDREAPGLLRDIPALGPLRREPVQPGEPFMTLLDRAIAGAERLRVVAFREATAGRCERHTPSALAAISVAMAMNHLTTHRILDDILSTDRRHRGEETRPTTQHLEQAAAAAKTAFDAWSRARERWLGVRAAWGPRDGQVLRAEAIDLATRLGRLTSADPSWTPRPGASHTMRPLEHLTVDDQQLTTVVDGLHRLATSSCRLAVEHSRLIDIQTVRGQLLVPTRRVPWQLDTHRAWVPAPPHATFALRRAYEEAGTAAGNSDRTLADLAKDLRGTRAVQLEREQLRRHQLSASDRACREARPDKAMSDPRARTVRPSVGIEL